MKILGADPGFNNANKVDEIRKQSQEALKTSKAAASKPEAATSAKSVETVAVSGMAHEAAKISKQVRVAPETRKEKVDALKDKIDKGEYHVSGDQVAGKIIEDIIRQAPR